ncbi:dihydropteroate synthase [Maribacter sp. 2307ULW6-5]|uniref:dihydropteroate synthase n=1 Tax=Maribacter sp. 2307ULW6-5 TaxID=3386275 RepID=UPI0039BCE610
MTINCRGSLIDLTKPKVMGILNITPDSFYDGGKYKDEKDILAQVEAMLAQGATFVDVGAYSSRPGAKEVTPTEELKRITPIVELLVRHFPEANLSIDTFRAVVAQACADRGAAMINDISAGALDQAMLPTMGKLKLPYVMMHMRGTPQDMQQRTDYQNLMKEIMHYFSQRIQRAVAHGVHDLVLDPGFGFAKTLEQNYGLLRDMDILKMAERPILAGISRKSMIYKVLGSSAQDALNGTTALHMVALQKGANILRAHDVKEAVECVHLYLSLYPEVAHRP